MLTNCVNCVAPIDPKLNKCPYCGTSYEAMGVNVERDEILLYADNKVFAAITQTRLNQELIHGLYTPNELRKRVGLRGI